MAKRKGRSIKNYVGWNYMTDKQKRFFENIFNVVSGGQSTFMHNADSIHLARLGRVMVAVGNMSSWERDEFIKENWIVFEEVFENSEIVRQGGGNYEISQEDANTLIDRMYDSAVLGKDPNEIVQTQLRVNKRL